MSQRRQCARRLKCVLQAGQCWLPGPAPRAQVDHPNSGGTNRRLHWTLLSSGRALARGLPDLDTPDPPRGLAQHCPIAAQTPRLWSRVHTLPALMPFLPHSKQAF